MLTSVKQIVAHQSYQLGSTETPCQVVYGPSKYDEGKAIRGIKITCPELPIMAAFDEEADDMHPLVKTYKEQQFVTLKIADDSDLPCPLTELVRGVKFLAIVKSIPWSMSGKQGISLRCVALKVLETKKEEYTFIE